MIVNKEIETLLTLVDTEYMSSHFIVYFDDKVILESLHRSRYLTENNFLNYEVISNVPEMTFASRPY